MWDIFSKVTISVVSSGLVSVLTAFYFFFFRKKKVVNSIDGDWYGVIFDPAGRVVKSDTFTLKKTGDAVAGAIKRTFPTDQVTRNWNFTGRIQAKSFFAIYWSDDELNVSSGCWFLRQVDDTTFDGFYFRRQQDSEDATPILSVPMVISRRPLDIHQSHDELLGKARPKARAASRRGEDETVVFLGKR